MVYVVYLLTVILDFVYTTFNHLYLSFSIQTFSFTPNKTLYTNSFLSQISRGLFLSNSFISQIRPVKVYKVPGSTI